MSWLSLSPIYDLGDDNLSNKNRRSNHQRSSVNHQAQQNARNRRRHRGRRMTSSRTQWRRRGHNHGQRNSSSQRPQRQSNNQWWRSISSQSPQRGARPRQQQSNNQESRPIIDQSPQRGARPQQQQQQQQQQSNNQRSRPNIDQSSQRRAPLQRRPSELLDGMMVIDEYAEEKIRERESRPENRLERLCYGWHNENTETRRKMDKIHQMLNDIGNISRQINYVQQKMENSSVALIKLLTDFSLNIEKLYNICTSAYDDMIYTTSRNDIRKPRRKAYIMQYFAALRVFEDKQFLGFQDVAKRSYIYIRNWSKIHQYEKCIIKLFQQTPRPLDNDMYELIRNKKVTAGTYYRAGLWCNVVLRRVRAIRRGEFHVRDHEAVLDYLYHIDNRNRLESQINLRKREFPFHTVKENKTLDEERAQELYQKLMDDEKAVAAAAKKKWRTEVAQQMRDLELQMEAHERKTEADVECIVELLEKEEEYKERITELTEQNRNLLATTRRMKREYATNAQVPIPFQKEVDMLETAEIAFCRMYLAERQYTPPPLPDDIQETEDANLELDPRFSLQDNDFIPDGDALYMPSQATNPDENNNDSADAL